MVVWLDKWHGDIESAGHEICGNEILGLIIVINYKDKHLIVN
jgi:hypothetical protein